MQKLQIGKVGDIAICCNLLPTDKKIEVSYIDLFKELKEEINQLHKEIENQNGLMDKFLSPISNEFIMKRDDYLRILHMKESIIDRRMIDDARFLSYLLLSLTIPEIKDIFKDYKIKGYSQMGKDEMIEYLILNLSKEEQREIILEKEQDIISFTIAQALRLINHKDNKEKIKEITKINRNEGIVEILFEGFDWEISCYIIANERNMNDPERNCDCKIGSNGGFCKHFWVVLMKALKEQFISIYNWNLTFLPERFEEYYKELKI